MIKDINQREKIRFRLILYISVMLLLSVICLSITVGQYNISLFDTIKALCNIIFHTTFSVSSTAIAVIEKIRLPRTIAAFIVGSCLSVSGNAFQSTFNNKLVSSDVLGVSSGACVGAAIAILLGVDSYFVSIFAFVFGLISVSLALLLPKLFKNTSSLMLVLSGIIVGSLMDSIIGLIKFMADKEEKLAEITFWIMGELAGVSNAKIVTVLPIYIISIVGVFLLRWKLNVLSLGEEEARTVGLDYRLYRFAIIIFSTLLTAASVSICGNVGWVGLVIPHIVRVIVGADNRFSMPIAFVFGGTFMILVDMLLRNLSLNEIPLSIITGIIGTVIYAVVLIRGGREVHE